MTSQTYNSVMAAVQVATSAPLTMSSMEIAELTGKEHKNVVRDIRVMCAGLKIEPSDFEGTYKDITGRALVCYNLPQRECLILVSGYSVELRARIIDRWQELEGAVKAGPAVPQTLPEALRLAADLADEVAQRKAEVAVLAPKAEALDRLGGSDGSMCFRNAAKTLKVRPCDLTGFMNQTRWVYKPAGTKDWIAYQDKIQAGYLEHVDHPYIGKDGREKVSTRARITAKGLVKLAELLNRAGLAGSEA